jgi:hypothetical protein
MTDYQGETAFLRQVIAYVDTAERRTLDERIAQAQRDERCVRRAAWLMALLAALAVAGLGYAAVLLPHHYLDMTRFFSHAMVKAFCALGLAALGCLLVFLPLKAAYAKRLTARCEECRQLAAKVIESRLGQPQKSLREPGSTTQSPG